MVKIIIAIYDFLSQRKWLIYITLAAWILVFGYFALQTKFKEDITGFLPRNFDSERISYAYSNIEAANALSISISQSDTLADADPDAIIEAIDRVVELLEAECSPYIKKMLYTIDQEQFMEVSSFIVDNLPLFLTEEDYQRADTIVTKDNLRHELEASKRWLITPAGSFMKHTLLADPLHLSSGVLSRLRGFQASNTYTLFDDYIFSSDSRIGNIIITPQYSSNNTMQNSRMMKILEKVTTQVEEESEGRMTITYFGSADIAVTNSTQIKRDSLLAMVISLILIIALLIYNFRDFKSLLLVAVSLIFGWIFAIGTVSLIRGEVSLIAIGISSIIMAIALNYPLHFLDCYHRDSNPRNVLKTIASPLTIGNITTVGAFLSLLFIRSDAMIDLGLFAAMILVGTILFVLLLLPHFIKASPQSGESANTPEKEFMPLLKFLPQLSKRGRKWIVVAVVVLSCILFCFSGGTKFESDMQKINYMTPFQQEQFQKMFRELNNNQQTIYFISEGRTMDEALSRFEASRPSLDTLLRSGVVTKMAGIGDFLPSKTEQQRRIRMWNQFWESQDWVLQALPTEGLECGFKADAFNPFLDIVTAHHSAQDIEYFSPIINSIAANYLIEGKERSMVFNLLYTLETDLDQIEERLGTIAEGSFAFDSGTINRTMITSLSDEFNLVLYFCGFIVFFFMILTMGRIEITFISFLPLTIGWFWILGIMNICDIRFNIINIILATLIFGQGDDYSIFMTDGLIYEYAHKKKLLQTYKNSILLSSIVMFIGIGSMIIARHPALRSLAEVTIIGMMSVVLMTYIFPPLIFRWLTQKNGHLRKMPVTILNLANTIFAFTIFLFGSLYLTLTGFFLLTLGGKTERHKEIYHNLLCGISSFVMNHIPRVGFKMEPIPKGYFDKPSIIIANHQSHLDIMCIMMLHPKIVIITNNWVWHSPFYGIIIRYADYYPASNGMDDIQILPLLERVKQGYSIMIFPEGTRSDSCEIGRFHKGAFYLAEKLGLDITPVLLHGTGHCLPKSELQLRKGEIRVRVLQKISPFNDTFGSNYSSLSKGIRHFMMDKYEDLCRETQTAEYFSDLVYHNYVYKGAEVERKVRFSLSKNKDFYKLINSISDCKEILVRNCGYGEFPLLASLVYKNIKITAICHTDEELSIARNCVSISENLHYSMDNSFENGNFDKIIEL